MLWIQYNLHISPDSDRADHILYSIRTTIPLDDYVPFYPSNLIKNIQKHRYNPTRYEEYRINISLSLQIWKIKD